jgi:hypothetical protein
LRHNRDFCDFDPPGARGQKSHETSPGGLITFLLYHNNQRLKYSDRYSPVRRTVRGFLPTPLGVGVTGPAPDDSGAVSIPRYAIKWSVRTRAKPQLTRTVPKCEGNGLHPWREQGSRAFPKRKARSIPSIRAVSWHARFAPGRKSSIASSISVRLRPRLAGSTERGVLHGLVFFIYFFLQIFMVALFEWANKIMII